MENPCRRCDHHLNGGDKNADRCRDCTARAAYVAAIGGMDCGVPDAMHFTVRHAPKQQEETPVPPAMKPQTETGTITPHDLSACLERLSAGEGEPPNCARLLIGLRTACGLSQRRLATLAGVSKGTIIDIEAGRRVPFRRSQKRIAKALGVDVEDLFPPIGWKRPAVEKPDTTPAGQHADPTDDHRPAITITVDPQRHPALYRLVVDHLAGGAQSCGA